MSGFESVMNCVNLDLGYIAVGFIRQSAEERSRFRRGESESVHIQQATAAAVVAGDEVDAAERGSRSRRHARDGGDTPAGPLWSRFLALLPSNLLQAVVCEYWATLSYAHCEVAFFLNEYGKQRYGDQMVIGAGMNNEGVFLSWRRYNSKYSWQHVRCDRLSMLAMLHYAWTQRGKPFSARHMTQMAIYPGPDQRERYFCAHFVMSLLEFLPLPAFHLNPCNKLTNDDVYHLVTRPENRPERVSEVSQVHYDSIFGRESRFGPPIKVDPQLQQRHANPT